MFVVFVNGYHNLDQPLRARYRIVLNGSISNNNMANILVLFEEASIVAFALLLLFLRLAVFALGWALLIL